MKLGKIVQKTIKIAGTISKVSVQLGADIIGTVAEKIDDDPEIKRKISEYGRIKGQAIKETTSEAATKSSEIVDKAVETSVNTLKDGSTIVKNSINQVKEGIDKSIKKMNTYNDPIKYNYDNKSNYNSMSNSNNRYSEHKSKDIIKEKNQKKTSNEPIPNKLIANLVGFSNQKQVLNNLIEGDKLELLRENSNMWDKNAIKVQRDMYNVLGYISKDVQEMIAPLMDRGEKFSCEVFEVVRDDANVNAIKLLIKVEDTISNNINKLQFNKLRPNSSNKSTDNEVTEYANINSPNNENQNARKDNNCNKESIHSKSNIAKKSKIESKKNRSDQYDYNFDVKILENDEILYDYEDNLIWDISKIEVDRRIGEDYTSFSWKDGELINILVYIKPIVDVINALSDKYSFEKYYGIPEKEKEARLKGISILIKPKCGSMATKNGQYPITDEECIDIILDYREAIFKDVKQKLHSVCEYSEEYGVYEYYLSGSLDNIHIDESEIETDGYYDYLAQSHDDEYNSNSSSYKDPDAWDQGDINEYYGYERDYDGDLD